MRRTGQENVVDAVAAIGMVVIAGAANLFREMRPEIERGQVGPAGAEVAQEPLIRRSGSCWSGGSPTVLKSPRIKLG